MDIFSDTILEAHERIRPHIHRTPVMTSGTINRIAEADVYFKCENFQKIGAFKIRGGMNAVLSLTRETQKKGIATHSSGNHAQAIAYAACQVKTMAYIVMPDNSPRVKVDAVKSYGAEIHFCKPTEEDREKTLKGIVERTGAEFVHPYNDQRVIAGQATCAKELIEDVGRLDIIITPVGGGGLLSGSLLAAEFFSPGTLVYAGEPEGAADAILSLKAGKIEKAPFVDTIADGLRTTLGDKTFPIINKFVKGIFPVSDKDIIRSLRLVYERMKIVIEPSAAVPLAALLQNKKLFTGKKVGVIFTGGNIDFAKVSGWFE